MLTPSDLLSDLTSAGPQDMEAPPPPHLGEGPTVPSCGYETVTVRGSVSVTPFTVAVTEPVKTLVATAVLGSVTVTVSVSEPATSRPAGFGVTDTVATCALSARVPARG